MPPAGLCAIGRSIFSAVPPAGSFPFCRRPSFSPPVHPCRRPALSPSAAAPPFRRRFIRAAGRLPCHRPEFFPSAAASPFRRRFIRAAGRLRAIVRCTFSAAAPPFRRRPSFSPPPLLFAAGSSVPPAGLCAIGRSIFSAVPPAGSFPFCCRPSFSLPVHPRRRTGPVPAAGTFPLLPPPLLFAAGSSAPPTGPRAIGRCASSTAPPDGPFSAKMPGREMPICRAAPRSCHSADNLAEIADWYDLCLF